MTGETLHTKYRPATLDEVVGQEHIKDGLSAQLAAGTQQTFLFEGPSGTGKTTLARICASQLGCTEVTEIDAATHTGVDAMREISSRANFMSLDGGGKAFIVDECHRLSKQAWESLLKDIEEPPKGVYWFFCTTEPAKILKTIRTRVVAHTLRDVSYKPLLRLVASIAEAEGLDVPEDVLDVCADEAGGSPRQAIVNLTSTAHAKTADAAREALSRAAVAPEAFDLAKLLVKPGYDFAAAMKLVKAIKDTPPESIRHVVRAYMTTVVLNNPGDRWPRGVLLAFEQPAIDSNQISDIVCRLITLEKWKSK